ncbi:hypothetical protein Golomagni_07552, partial [Golovinomyces magnicellulatus]
FPYTEHETVPNWLLAVLCAVLPVVVIFFVSLIFVPGSTVPSNTPWVLVWKRKLWELHIAWLGLLMAVGSAFFFVSGIKNMCGKPRPDMLARCMPDMANADKYVVGGYQIDGANGRLYSAEICTQTDKHKLWDGFRSYPSGHAGASAAGLIYLSLFLASKFVVTIPWIIPSARTLDANLHAAFPSRAATESSSTSAAYNPAYDDPRVADKVAERHARHNANIQSIRRQAAAPPVYLLAITLVPFCISIFISASRWFDYRHHGFDILFGFLIGIITSIYSFRYYHMPIRSGAGWAWAPRSPDRSFWSGVGRIGFGNDLHDGGDEPTSGMLSEGQSNDVQRYPQYASQPTNGHGQSQYSSQPLPDVEMNRMHNEVDNRV